MLEYNRAVNMNRITPNLTLESIKDQPIDLLVQMSELADKYLFWNYQITQKIEPETYFELMVIEEAISQKAL